jgi:hypothetical protein
MHVVDDDDFDVPHYSEAALQYAMSLADDRPPTSRQLLPEVPFINGEAVSNRPWQEQQQHLPQQKPTPAIKHTIGSPYAQGVRTSPKASDQFASAVQHLNFAVPPPLQSVPLQQMQQLPLPSTASIPGAAPAQRVSPYLGMQSSPSGIRPMISSQHHGNGPFLEHHRETAASPHPHGVWPGAAPTMNHASRQTAAQSSLPPLAPAHHGQSQLLGKQQPQMQQQRMQQQNQEPNTQWSQPTLVIPQNSVHIIRSQSPLSPAALNSFSKDAFDPTERVRSWMKASQNHHPAPHKFPTHGLATDTMSSTSTPRAISTDENLLSMDHTAEHLGPPMPPMQGMLPGQQQRYTGQAHQLRHKSPDDQLVAEAHRAVEELSQLVAAGSGSNSEGLSGHIDSLSNIRSGSADTGMRAPEHMAIMADGTLRPSLPGHPLIMQQHSQQQKASNMSSNRFVCVI